MRINNRIVSSTFRDLVKDKYPGLNKNAAYWGLMQLLMFSTWVDDETDELIISQSLLAAIESKRTQYESRNYKAIDLLEGFLADVMANEGFLWSDWSYRSEKARTVKEFKLNSEVEIGLNLEMKTSVCKEDKKVYFIDGKRFSEARLKKKREEIKSEALRLHEKADCLIAKEILIYLNSLPSNRFGKILSNMKEAIVEARLIDKSSKLKPVVRQLRAIAYHPQPFYQPSSKGNTVRIFALNESLLGLPKRIRRIFTKDWYDVDLKNSQLAICAKDWNVPIVIDFLATGKSVWEELFAHFGFDYGWKNTSPEKFDLIKKSFKKALYSLIFGMKEPSIKAILTKALARYTSKAGNTFFKNTLVKALSDARKQRIKQITAAGGATTSTGKQIEVEMVDGKGKSNVDSILAQQAQATEMILMYPIIQLARDTDNYDVVLWQHDGCSIAFKDNSKAETQLKGIIQAVAHKAKEMNITTELEVTET